MDFFLSEEQYAVQTTAKKYLAEHCHFEARQKLLARSDLAQGEHWKRFCELGWVGLALPVEVGGYGGSSQDILAIAQEFGRSLVLEPYLANAILAGTVLARCDNSRLSEMLLAKLIAGERQFSLAYNDSETCEDRDFTVCTFDDGNNGYRIKGRKSLVYNASNCDELLVTARLNDNDRNALIVFRVAPGTDGVAISSSRSVDGFSVSTITLSDVLVDADSVLTERGDQVLDAAIRRGALYVCAEAVGIMESMLEKTIEYVKARRQFGVPLSSFQVVQHKLADMFVEVEQSRSMLYRWAIEGERQTHIWHAAKARISVACRLVGEEAVQLHGGMGISNELDIGHYFKRLTAISILFGDADYHLGEFSGSI